MTDARYLVERRAGGAWSGITAPGALADAETYLADNPGDDLRIVTGTGDVVTYGDAGGILQPGQDPAPASSREAKRLREHGYTLEQKQDARDEHRALLETALERLTTPAGMSAWLLAREIHGAELTPANAALAALQAPGQLVGTARYWKRQGVRIGKGQRHTLRLTGKTFWPVAAWTLDSFGGDGMPPLPIPDRAECERLAASWASCGELTAPALTEWVDATAPALVEGEALETDAGDLEQVAIPF